MKTFVINNRQVEFDETIEYADFWVTGPTFTPNLSAVDFDGILVALESGKWKWEEIGSIIRDLTRWVHEAPRKRHYRELLVSGITVCSTEHFFHDWEEGPKFIDALENTGKIAARLCEVFGVEPMRPILQDDPSVSVKSENLSAYEDHSKSPYRR